MVFRAFGGPLEAKSVRSRARYCFPVRNKSSEYHVISEPEAVDDGGFHPRDRVCVQGGSVRGGAEGASTHCY